MFLFHFRSTVDILRIYFVHITPLVIKFCFGSHVLAHATVPVEQLIPFNDHILQNTAVLNRSFDVRLNILLLSQLKLVSFVSN